VSEQMPEQTSGEPGSLGAGLAVPNSLNAPSEPVAASAQPSMPEAIDVDSPKLAPEQGAAGETPKADAPKVDAPKADAPAGDAPRIPGKVLIMSAGDRAGPAEQSSGMFGKRRLAALAAVVALAAVAGALGGALATAGLGHSLGALGDAATTAKPTLRGSMPTSRR
jgi:hypothetical protein